jgi:putative membrane protein insertion efficiency factor
MSTSLFDRLVKVILKRSITENLRRLWKRVFVILDSITKLVLALGVGLYRTIGTTHLGGCCRYEPSCSQYAVECLSQFNGFKALLLISKRLLRCRPGAAFGYDPVPQKD